MSTSKVGGQVQVWAHTKWEKADGSVFYQSPSQPYNTDNKMRQLWEVLRCHYCRLNKHGNTSLQYITGLPLPRNLVLANINLLGKVLLKEAKTWLKEQF